MTNNVTELAEAHPVSSIVVIPWKATDARGCLAIMNTNSTHSSVLFSREAEYKVKPIHGLESGCGGGDIHQKSGTGRETQETRLASKNGKYIPIPSFQRIWSFILLQGPASRLQSTIVFEERWRETKV